MQSEATNEPDLDQQQINLDFERYLSETFLQQSLCCLQHQMPDAACKKLCTKTTMHCILRPGPRAPVQTQSLAIALQTFILTPHVVLCNQSAALEYGFWQLVIHVMLPASVICKYS